MIQPVRKAVYGQLKNTDVTNEELLSTLARAEGLINSRALTYQSADLCDVVLLTLNH